jgi:hypothetical protein
MYADLAIAAETRLNRSAQKLFSDAKIPRDL